FPYFFLDPTQVTGIESTFYCVIAAALVVAMGAAVIALGRVVPPLVEGSRLHRPTRRGKIRD
ncbi:MAG: hypothetical protein JWQ43_4048, partial [Glaciihabitans sp.]|nr:hypothetical protein [Glaciihabitans sp.]